VKYLCGFFRANTKIKLGKRTAACDYSRDLNCEIYGAPMKQFLIVAFLLMPFARVDAKEAAAPPKLAVNNAVQLKKCQGQTVTVVGKISRATVSKSGHHFLNFYGSNLTVVCFKQELSKFDKGGPAKVYSNKEVHVTGKLETYKGKPQIKLTLPTQISLATATTSKAGGSKSGIESPDKKFSLADVKVGSAATDKKVKFELKQLGKTTWISPAGLRYAGKDPEGLTRVEHVLRHAADQPKRAGSHGVVDGGNDQALATVDEAWKLVKKKKIKPSEEGRTSAYLIPMGRRVGYLGGRSGASRGKPPLKKVFIVVRTGTSEVITAFPR